MNSRGLIRTVAVVGASLLSPYAASAQTINFQSFVQAAGAPLTITQNAQVNGAGVIQFGSGASVSVTQTGTSNFVGILQFGSPATAMVGQSGATNFAFIGQTAKLPIP